MIGIACYLYSETSAREKLLKIRYDIEVYALNQIQLNYFDQVAPLEQTENSDMLSPESLNLWQPCFESEQEPTDTALRSFK